MDMGNSSSGWNFFYFIGNDDNEPWFIAIVIVLLIVGALLLVRCEHQYNIEFCSDVCSQYESEPVVKGDNCYCRDAKGIYDPSMIDRNIEVKMEK